MISHTTARFWRRYRRLPEHVRRNARAAYEKFAADPSHPSLEFKCIQGSAYSARVSLGYRVLGDVDGSTIVWHFIGTHREYEREIRRL